MEKIECFKIQVHALEDGKWEKVLRLENDRHFGLKVPTVILADPFLFVHNGALFLFYEHKKLRRPGTIMMMWTDDLEHWSEPAEVLREPFHLSYPWVFEKNGHVYMIPETCADRSVRLYEAANDGLTEFRYVRKLLEGDADGGADVSFSDSSIVERDGIYYLFTTVQSQSVNQLLLFCSDSFAGPYRGHPCSPICVSRKYGRNAGSLLTHEGGLYRAAQDCEKRYGDNVHILKVTALSPEDYREEVCRESILDTADPFYREGGHQLNVARFKGRTIIATDAKEYHMFFFARLLNKLTRNIKGGLQ